MSTETNEKYGIFNCPNCGAAAGPESVSCAYCKSSLATRVCASCFGAVSVGMHHCPWCGSGATGEPDVPGDFECPRCEVKLSSVNVGAHTLQECQHCGGLWVDRDTFQEICIREEEQEAVLGFEDGAVQQSVPIKPTAERAYIPCPRCGKLMNRQQFAGCSRVILDICRDHGTWFDRHELRQIITFIQSGGLRKSREREKEKLEIERSRLRQQQLSSSVRPLSSGEGMHLATGMKDDPESLVQILSTVWRSLNK